MALQELSQKRLALDYFPQYAIIESQRRDKSYIPEFFAFSAFPGAYFEGLSRVAG